MLANPTNPTLINNRVYSLANLDRLDEAERLLQQLLKTTDRDSIFRMHPALLATSGLICYRRGDLAHGQELYTASIEMALHAGEKRLAARAALFFALEEIHARMKSQQSAIRALELSSEFVDRDFSLLRQRLSEWKRHRVELVKKA